MSRDKAIEAIIILNFFVEDLLIGTQTLVLIETISERRKTVSQRIAGATLRMCLSYLVVTLCKYLEFHKNYHQLIPEECKSECKNLYKELRKRDIHHLRNKFIGHIINKDTGKPLTTNEILESLKKITNDDLPGFRSWINNPADNNFPKTIVGIVEHTRDQIQKNLKIQSYELFQGAS